MRASARRSRIDSRRAIDPQLLQRAQAAVNGLLVIEGCAAAEVGRLDQRHRQAALRRVGGDRQPVDAAADDQHVVTWSASAAGSRGRMREIYLIVGEQPCKLRMASDNSAVRDYWNQHIHDLEITRHPVGSPGFFADLDQYHFEKLHHLLRLVDFDGYRGQRVLEVGCGAGTDLARFAKGGADVTGVDLSASAIALARQNFAQQGLTADLREADGEQLPFADDTFDLVYAHGVVQYTGGIARLVRRVPPRAQAGRRGDVPGLQPHLVAERAVEADEGGARARGRAGAAEVQRGEFEDCSSEFRDVRIVEERFPVKSRLHGGWKGTLFNTFFVGTFNALPRAWSAASAGTCWRSAANEVVDAKLTRSGTTSCSSRTARAPGDSDRPGARARACATATAASAPMG